MKYPTVFIYALRDPRDGLIRYIGQTRVGIERVRQHMTPSCRFGYSNLRKREWLTELINLGTKAEIVVLAECLVQDLNDAEVFCIAYFRWIGIDIFNMTNGGPGMSGLKMSDEAKAKIGKIRRGMRHSAESKEKMSKSRMGHLVSAETRAKQAKSMKGQKRTPEQRARISTGRMKAFSRAFSDQYGNVYQNQKEAALAIGVQPQDISKLLTGWTDNEGYGRKSIRGFRFHYLDNKPRLHDPP